jgi:hypothetical protein
LGPAGSGYGPLVVESLALGGRVGAVDLHVGQRIGIELGHDWMRVYLHAGSCGNTVARLISNLQTRFDGALTLTHPRSRAERALSSRQMRAVSEQGVCTAADMATAGCICAIVLR